MPKDPICGMKIDPKKAEAKRLTARRQGKKYYLIEELKKREKGELMSTPLIISWLKKRIQELGREGEKIVLELARRMRDGKSYDDIPNTWVKKEDGTIIKNPIAHLVDINEIMPDFSLFEKRQISIPSTFWIHIIIINFIIIITVIFF